MGFKCGFVGLPNVGKSTIFNALTAAGIEVANYPFCTIEPNTGMVEVPDPRLHHIAKIAKSAKTIPTFMEFVDIAGLVAGASKGEGLGNQFLGHIRSVQAIAHVVRCFEDDNITHVSGQVDPISDIETIDTELALADLQSLEKAQQKLQKSIKAGDKAAKQEQVWIEKIIDHLSQTPSLHALLHQAEIKEICKKYQLLCAKPVFYIANVAEESAASTTLLQRVKQYADQKSAPVVAICASIEAEICDLDDEDQALFLQELGMQEPGLHQVIREGHRLLSLSTFFTAGPKEARAWTIPTHATAAKAAGAIHSDFEKHFIRAEVIGYEDYIQHHGEQGAKQAGAWRLEGKEYCVADGDILLIRANA